MPRSTPQTFRRAGDGQRSYREALADVTTPLSISEPMRSAVAAYIHHARTRADLVALAHQYDQPLERAERDLLALEHPYLLVRRTEPGATYDAVAADLDRVARSANPPLRFLIDSYHPGQSGGTGALADWELAARLAAVFPILLAGGLNPENVESAIDQVRPAGVDVSTGVEIDGAKSDERIRAFVENARRAFADQSSSSDMTVQP